MTFHFNPHRHTFIFGEGNRGTEKGRKVALSLRTCKGQKWSWMSLTVTCFTVGIEIGCLWEDCSNYRCPPILRPSEVTGCQLVAALS